MIRAGIIGWGENGANIAKALHFEIKDCEVIGLASKDPRAIDFATRKMRLKHIFSDYRALLELHQIDIICICSDSGRHVQQVEDALKSGSNILIDHPLASNVEDCKKLEQLLNSYPSYKSMVAFPRRFDHRYQAVKDAIDLGKLGHLSRVSIHSYESMPIQDEVNQTTRLAKGIFMDMMINDIDTVRWLTGQNFEKVYVLGNALQYPSLERHDDADTAICVGSLDKGCLIQLTSTRIVHGNKGTVVHVVGTNGEVKLDDRTGEGNLFLSQQDNLIKIKSNEVNNPYLPMIKTYVDAVKYGNRLPYALSEGTSATRVGVAMTKSFVLGGEINIES